MTTASFSPDNSLLAVGFGRIPAQIWDTETWQVVAELPNDAQAVAFSPDGQYLAVSRSWYIDIWRVSDLVGEAEN
jgi:WD40 repeat protein